VAAEQSALLDSWGKENQYQAASISISSWTEFSTAIEIALMARRSWNCLKSGESSKVLLTIFLLLLLSYHSATLLLL
jgi:hypothetical protein